MLTLSTNEAAVRLATVVEKATPGMLSEISAELLPQESEVPLLSALDLATHVSSGLAAEELIDLWNVVFPADCNVWYDGEDEKFHYNEEVVGYAEAD